MLTVLPPDRLNGFKTGTTQPFNSWEVIQLAYFPKQLRSVSQLDNFVYSSVKARHKLPVCLVYVLLLHLSIQQQNKQMLRERNGAQTVE